MVYFEDTGSILDAPIEFVWEYLGSEQHGPAHRRSGRAFAVRETVGTTATIAAERWFEGEWRAFVTKSTDHPPLCIVNEEIEGDFAGSTFVIVYHPDGPRTRVDVYGEVRSPRFPPEEAREKFLGLLDGAYEDDVIAIRALRAEPGPSA
jgi:hypothetical protein